MKHFDKNTVGRDFVVGDIHGHFSTLEEIMEIFDFEESKDRIFSVGDLVDRGPECPRALEFLGKPWFHAVMGNHEKLCLDIITGESMLGLHPQNGSSWILKEIESHPEYLAAFNAMPLVLDVMTDAGLIGLIHAECPVDDWNKITPEMENEHIFRQACVWSRDKVYWKDDSIIKNVHKVFHGHTIMPEVTNLGNRTYIDTGVFLPEGNLTMIQIQ